MKSRHPLSQHLAPAALLAVAAMAGGQAQVNLQVNTQINPSNAPLNQGSMLYSRQNAIQNPLLPSQQRYEIMQSGMLPSELRMGATAAGPLAPGGVTSYVPGGTPLARASGGGVEVPVPQGPLAIPSGSLHYTAGSMGVGPDWRTGGGPIISMPPGQEPLTGPPPLIRHPIETQPVESQPAATQESTSRPAYVK